MKPVLGDYFLPEQFSDFPGNLVATFASLLVIGTGVSLLLWRSRISFLGITGGEMWVRFVLICSPLILLAVFEVALIAADGLNPPRDGDDKLARKLMTENWGKLNYKNLPMVAPVKSRVFNVNSNGFRTYDLSTPARGETRVMLLGGSTAFGWGVADQHGIGHYLEETLDAKTTSRVMVFNLSVPAIRFSEENLILKDFFKQVSPDVVVFYHGANDALTRQDQTNGHVNSNQSLAPSFFSWASFLHYAYKSNVFRLATEALRSSRDTGHAQEVDVSRAITEYEAQFAVSRDLCAPTRCLYIIQPIIFNKRLRTAKEVKIYRNATTLFPQYEQMYVKFTDAIVSKNLVNHVDGRKAFSQSSDTLFMDFVHVMPEGNRLMAGFIADALCGGGYVRCK